MDNVLTIDINNTVEQVKENLLSSLLGNEIVMMHTGTGNYFCLNRIGSVIWEQLVHPVQVNELIRYLTGRFNVDNNACTTDTLNYLQDMYERKIIRVIQ